METIENEWKRSMYDVKTTYKVEVHHLLLASTQESELFFIHKHVASREETSSLLYFLSSCSFALLFIFTLAVSDCLKGRFFNGLSKICVLKHDKA